MCYPILRHHSLCKVKIKVQYNEYNMFSGTKCLSFVNIPIFLEIVFEIASMWFFHVRFSSIITPKHFVEITLFKDTPSSLTLSLTFFYISRAGWFRISQNIDILIYINEFPCTMMSTEHHVISLNSIDR